MHSGKTLTLVIMVSSLSAEPHFLHAIDYGNYIYFFLSEIAVEYTALGKVPRPWRRRRVAAK